MTATNVHSLVDILRRHVPTNTQARITHENITRAITIMILLDRELPLFSAGIFWECVYGEGEV